ncbi:MAG: hypothetical protein ED859_03125 [Desulfuromonadales bacterium]|nr:MAG: hypothetical protein ED859_03125 [Desulfuromonadales bacterium]
MSSFESFGDKLQNILSRRGAQLAKILSAKGSEAEARMSKAGDTVRKNAEKAAESVKAEQQTRKEGDKKKTKDAAKKSQAPQGKKQPAKEPCKKCGETDKLVWKPYTKTDKKGRLKNPHGGGYVYWGSRKHALGKSGEWDKLISEGVKTESEKKVILAVAGNEGKMDSVQSYDRMVVSLGAMQKTINLAGEGELANQIDDFKNEAPEEYKELFEDKGWIVRQDKLPIYNKKGQKIREVDSRPRLYYKNNNDPNPKEITGDELKQYLNSRDNEINSVKAHKALLEAGRDPAFQRKQILDYNVRLLSSINSTAPTYKHKMKDYITSEKGRALALDTSVNLGEGGASKVYQQSLDEFFRNNPLADKDPSRWPPNRRQGYEDALVGYLEKNRNKVTDYFNRNAAILGNSSQLNGEIRSMQLPKGL